MSEQRQIEIEKIIAIKHEWLKSKSILSFEEFAVDKGFGTVSRFESVYEKTHEDDVRTSWSRCIKPINYEKNTSKSSPVV